MKRWVLRIFMFLLLGVILNVTVAWGFLNIVPIWDLGMFGPDTSDAEQQAWWWIHRPAVADFGPDGLSMGINPGALVEHIYPFDDSAECVTVIRVSAGWPMHSLIGGMWQTRAGRHVASTTMVRVSDQLMLPLNPLWPGFAINTMFYAAILWGLFALGRTPFAFRRRRRIKRGVCPKCAYDLRAISSLTCPECGTSNLVNIAHRYSANGRSFLQTARVRQPQSSSNRATESCADQAHTQR